MTKLQLKRAYEPAEKSDGYRVLVDRLWPRGVSKEKTKINLWLKNIAPSSDLRKWFNHDDGKADEFARRYYKELSLNPEVEKMKQVIKEHPVVTLVYAASSEVNNATVLYQYLTR